MQFDRVIKTRKSVRRYSDKKPDWRKIIRALDLARFAPAAGSQFVLKFILVKDKNKINDLKEACQQDFVGSVSYIVVAVSDDSKLKKSYDKRGKKFARQQAGAAIENFLLGLNEAGLATCWVGYFVDQQVKKILEIPNDMTVEALFPIGNETKVAARKKSKPELENLLYFDKWKNKYMEPRTRVSVESA